MTNRTVLIGIDGATFDILDPLMEAEVMPYLREFVQSGVCAELCSVIPPLTPPAWTSVMTGCSPGQHGIFDFFIKASANSPQIRFASSHDVGCETVWSMVNRRSMRAAALNFPLMFPAPQIDGFVVPGGWMPWRQLRLGCHPPDLYERLSQLPGFNPRELAMDMAQEEKAVEGCEPEEYADWIIQHVRREQQWYEILALLMREEPCELTGVLFDGVDKLQHLCWRFLDPVLWSGDATPWEQRVRDLCLEYFRRLDQILAGVVDLAGPDATVVIVSDHGFGAQAETFFVNAWLEEQGYLTWADGMVDEKGDSTKLGMSQLARHVYLLDWERTLAYAPTPSANGIHIVRDEGEGRGVSPNDYERFRQELMDGLARVVSPSTGEPMVSRMWTREEAFQGPHMALAPDLTLALHDGGLISILASDVPVKVRGQPTGTHRPEGIFLAAGPGVRCGAQVDELSILDVAPLLLHSLGVPVPEQMTGRVPTEILTSEWLHDHPVHSAAPGEPSPLAPRAAVEMVYSEKEEKELARRLRELGYIE